MTDKPIIRNLESLRRDMVDELRQALQALHQGRPLKEGTLLEPADAHRVERKIRNTLEFLTGDRE